MVELNNAPLYPDYNVDVAVCLDVSGSMEARMPQIKQFVCGLEEGLRAACEERAAELGAVRVRLITFRDYAFDENPMELTPFFALPEEKQLLIDFMDGIECTGGGDEAENSLEALALAMRSPWNNSSPHSRQLICLFTDADAVPLGKRAGCKGYPEGLPADIDAFVEQWETGELGEGFTFSKRNSRLFACTPDGGAWDMFLFMDRAMCLPIDGDLGKEDLLDIMFCVISGW